MTTVTRPADPLRAAVRSMAVFEAFKGVLVLCTLLGLLGLLHHDLHRLVLEWIRHFGLSPESRFPAALIAAVNKINTTPVHTLVLIGGSYVAMRWLEAWALWQDKAWGEWLGVVVTGMYIPLELHHFWLQRHWQAGLIVLVNIAVVIVLLAHLYRRHQKAQRVPAPSAAY